MTGAVVFCFVFVPVLLARAKLCDRLLTLLTDRTYCLYSRLLCYSMLYSRLQLSIDNTVVEAIDNTMEALAGPERAAS